MVVVTVSHGADFFGVDHYQAKALAKVAEYVSCLAWADGRADLVQLLQDVGEERLVPAEQAGVFSAALHRVASNGGVTPVVARQARALADAAARAAADGDTWTLTPATTAGEVIA